jgi:SAM-dependent methyltransferase
MDLRSIMLPLVRFALPLRRWQYSQLRRFASGVKEARIIEIGAGSYDISTFFDGSNDVTKTDLDGAHGHTVVDVTKWGEEEAYDVVLCLNVLEHVFEARRAVQNIHRALRPSGKAFVAVPGFYPLHDLPYDYWRFTEYSLREMFGMFDKVVVRRLGPERFPLSYVVIAEKGE